MNEDDHEVVGDVLDLHTFRPSDVKELIPDYIASCIERGYQQVRIIHGKGRGTLRRIVHAALERNEAVESYELAEPFAGGWGATIVRLRTT
ncbi:MAG: Smr/MutS family protein [Deltaproteobacteria bacterium]|nr:Smr/MutS family protein [Deltaproteobacteria bacterium]